MKFRVVLQRHARRDIVKTHAWISQRAPLAADRWVSRLQEKIRTLEQAPDRCPQIAERHRLKFSVRELLFGRRPYVFRIVYVVDGSTVRVLRVRRGQRAPLTPREIDDALADDDNDIADD